MYKKHEIHTFEAVVHLVRNSLRYVPSKDYKAFTASLKKLYGAPSLKAYQSQFESFQHDILRVPYELDNTHPTQKPVALFKYLIETYTLPGQVVLDNCMGSGTTAIACMDSQRQFIGFEKDFRFWRMANQRIDRNTTQMSLF